VFEDARTSGADCHSQVSGSVLASFLVLVLVSVSGFFCLLRFQFRIRI
jgi:hypothetical protein